MAKLNRALCHGMGNPALPELATAKLNRAQSTSQRWPHQMTHPVFLIRSWNLQLGVRRLVDFLMARSTAYLTVSRADP